MRKIGLILWGSWRKWISLSSSDQEKRRVICEDCVLEHKRVGGDNHLTYLVVQLQRPWFVCQLIEFNLIVTQIWLYLSLSKV